MHCTTQHIFINNVRLSEISIEYTFFLYLQKKRHEFFSLFYKFTFDITQNPHSVIPNFNNNTGAKKIYSDFLLNLVQ